METKQEIRSLVKKLRKQMTPEEWQEKTGLITEKVTGSVDFLEATDLFCYVDFNHEVGTEGIMKEAWKLGKNVWIPKVFGEEMEFFRIDSLDNLEKGNFGVLEPAEYGKKADETDALVIVPGVAFDKNCNRIGYGKGYYDKYLSVHPTLNTIGIAFDIQLIEELPVEENDRRLDAVITETLEIRNMETNLPKDPVLLLSVVNTKLRDFYSSLDALCEDMHVDRDTIVDTLKGMNYEYDESRNQFI